MDAKPSKSKMTYKVWIFWYQVGYMSVSLMVLEIQHIETVTRKIYNLRLASSLFLAMLL